MTCSQLWKNMQGGIQTLVTPLVYFSLFVPTKVDEIELGDVLEITVPSALSVKNMEKYRALLEQNANKIAKKEITINIKAGKVEKQENGSSNLGPLFEQNKDEIPTQPSNKKIVDSGLSPRLTFDNYLTGGNNQLAYAVAQAIVDKPGERYNPFFLYSGVGLGKTHLIHAIGNEILKKHPKLKVIYTTGETFGNELIAAIRGGHRGGITTTEFRKKYREVDVFLIDDIQFIAGKESTQEEFFHTFNSLHMSQKQIIITSDRHPRNFNNLEDRITSRFSSGMIADISKPTVDMRIAILQEMRDKNKDKISDSIIQFIAESVDSNIRELEGYYNQVNASPNPTIEQAAKLLGRVLEEKQNKQINLNDIMKTVANYYSVSITDIKGKRRTKEFVVPRQVAMYLMYDLTKTPYMTIGEVIGGRDHTTVLHGIRQVEAGLGNPQKVKQDLTNIKTEIYS